MFFALDVAVGLLLKEGLPNIFDRHARIGQKAREGVRSLGLSLFADEKYASNTVTSINAPDGIDANKIRAIMFEEHGIVLAGGQQTMAGKIFRIGHLGKVQESDIDEVIEGLRGVLPKLGYNVS